MIKEKPPLVPYGNSLHNAYAHCTEKRAGGQGLSQYLESTISLLLTTSLILHHLYTILNDGDRGIEVV